ncbi:unnamed protein product [Gongylonema pulchrum]|uniref:Smad anchor for receptor activation-like C-terminal domain-containing protein n=1 Tax=Gongylonema pulchrum TaxID=637853 RepID=A0A3P7R575_9BILA|nr:unnamed protein product [Gongylonema pulchrum]
MESGRCVSSSEGTSESSRVGTKPVLKPTLKAESVTAKDLDTPSSSDAAAAAAAKRSVTFRDGHGSKTRASSRRLKQLHVSEECVCFLPNDDNCCLHLRSSDGAIVECANVQQYCIPALRNEESIDVMIFRNLWCTVKLCEYDGKTAMCISSRGMSFIYEIYEFALTPQNESADEELGIRLAHHRVPALHRTTYFSNSEKPVARDILLFRPAFQDFKNLPVPSSPFLVAAFIHHSESIWANVIPQRLLIRLGLQASFYPTPLINDLERKPVYSAIFDTSVLKMFNDFRNWRFRMPVICGSTLTIKDNNETHLIVPAWANDEIAKLIKTNKNMLSWGLDFNTDADSHLVSEQDEQAGSFDSQIFTNGIAKLIKTNKNMLSWGLDFNTDADSHLVSEQDEQAGSFDSQIFTNGVGNRKCN